MVVALHKTIGSLQTKDHKTNFSWIAIQLQGTVLRLKSFSDTQWSFLSGDPFVLSVGDIPTRKLPRSTIKSHSFGSSYISLWIMKRGKTKRRNHRRTLWTLHGHRQVSDSQSRIVHRWCLRISVDTIGAALTTASLKMVGFICPARAARSLRARASQRLDRLLSRCISIDKSCVRQSPMRYRYSEYSSITYYWTGLPILDHSLVGNLTNSKIAETKP